MPNSSNGSSRIATYSLHSGTWLTPKVDAATKISSAQSSSKTPPATSPAPGTCPINVQIAHCTSATVYSRGTAEQVCARKSWLKIQFTAGRLPGVGSSPVPARAGSYVFHTSVLYATPDEMPVFRSAHHAS